VYKLPQEVVNLDARSGKLQLHPRVLDGEEDKLLRDAEEDDNLNDIRNEFDNWCFRLCSELTDLDHRLQRAFNTVSVAEFALRGP
jgi:hypothetical protein